MSWTDYWNTAKSWFGYQPDQKVGKDLGRYLGQLGSEYIPIPGVNGSQFGEWIGSFLPFKEGGKVPSNLRGLMMRPYEDESYFPIEKHEIPLWFKEGGEVPFRGLMSYLPVQKTDFPHIHGFKNGGRIPPLAFSNIPHLSFSNILAQMKDERPKLQPYKKGGIVDFRPSFMRDLPEGPFARLPEGPLTRTPELEPFKKGGKVRRRKA